MYNMQGRYWFKNKPNLLIIKDTDYEQIEKSKKILDTFHTTEYKFNKENQTGLINYILMNPIDAIYTNIRDYKFLKKLLELNIPIYTTYKHKLFSMKKVNDYIFKNTYTMGGIKKSFFNVFLKRLLDICISFVGCCITVTLFLILTPLICIESHGSPIFRQKRIGLNGRIFDFYKFRSMKENAEESKFKLMKHNEMDQIMFKIKDDPRITKVGRFIRKTSLDEFPQFFQVLKGEMSIVGTRPPLIDEFEQYDFHHKSRLCCKPGITGLWQTTGKERESSFEKIVELDNEYIRKSSALYDIWIIFKTIFVMFHNN